MVFLIDEVIMENVFNTGVNPVHTGIYIVDRGEKLGTPLRRFNADTGVWSRCEYTMEDILQSKDKPGALGFLPWRGPIKVVAPKVQPVAEVALVNTTDIQVTPTTKPAKVPKVKAVKVAKAPKVKTAKVTHVDGTSRIQTVPSDDSGIRQLLEAWYEQTNCPMLLNTSLNIRGEPMVNDRADADRFEQLYNVRVHS
jgi:hypothetical protein